MKPSILLEWIDNVYIDDCVFTHASKFVRPIVLIVKCCFTLRTHSCLVRRTGESLWRDRPSPLPACSGHGWMGIDCSETTGGVGKKPI